VNPDQSNSDAEMNSAAQQSSDAGVQDMTADQEMDLVRTQFAEARDKMLRAQAELDNYRKRARRELDDERKYAEINLLRDLLPVLDNITRAIDHAEKKADPAALVEGVRMVAQQLETLLKRHHCLPIEAQGQSFDPALHEAVMQQPSPDQSANTVVNVVQPGYQLYDRVVRPAQVIVSK
jgi:molecular chaperone GrpE